MRHPVDQARARAQRSDARANRERLIDAAVRAIGRDGVRVPGASIAAEAGDGVATFYRSFADRDALMQALESRAYAALNQLLDGIEDDGLTGLPAVHRFLTESLAIGDRLILPLHGAPPLIDAVSVGLRQRIDSKLEKFIAEGRRTSAIGAAINASDVIMCSALISQPLRHGPAWERSARRHIALFVAGMTSGRELPGPAVRQSDIERAFRSRARDAATVS